jgi:CheY-like chemotaxis protein
MSELYLQPLFAPEVLDDKNAGGIAITHFPFVIGRHPECDYCIDNSLISRHHCVFFLQGNQVYVQDLGSLNGTKVNVQPLRSPKPIQDGDEICLFFLAYLVHLPVQPDAPAVQLEDTVLRLKSESEAKPQRVLLVEDNQDTARTLAMLIKEWGHEVQVAHDGPKALDAARAQPPDLVLLDIRLPGMDGYQLARQLRTQAGLKQTRLVGLTGYQEDDDNRQSQLAGISRLLTKPVKSAILREVIGNPN